MTSLKQVYLNVEQSENEAAYVACRNQILEKLIEKERLHQQEYRIAEPARVTIVQSDKDAAVEYANYITRTSLGIVS